jgi:hypothetical protein
MFFNSLHYVGFEVLTAVVVKSTTLWDITPYSPLPPAFILASSSAYSSALKMEAICSSETSVDFQIFKQSRFLQCD